MAQMRLALQTQRTLDYDRAVDGHVRRKTANGLRMAILGGAEVMQMESLIGSIVPGKRKTWWVLAIMILIRCLLWILSGRWFFTVVEKHRHRYRRQENFRQDSRLVEVVWQSRSNQITSRSQRPRNQAAKVDMEKGETRYCSIFEKAMQI